MNRIRIIVNAELIGQDKQGREHVVKMGAGDFFEATKVEVLKGKGYDGYADIHLLNGLVIQGVGLDLFENHGTPQEEVIIDESETTNGPTEVSTTDGEELSEESRTEEREGLYEGREGTLQGLAGTSPK